MGCNQSSLQDNDYVNEFSLKSEREISHYMENIRLQLWRDAAKTPNFKEVYVDTVVKEILALKLSHVTDILIPVGPYYREDISGQLLFFDIIADNRFVYM